MADVLRVPLGYLRIHNLVMSTYAARFYRCFRERRPSTPEDEVIPGASEKGEGILAQKTTKFVGRLCCSRYCQLIILYCKTDFLEQSFNVGAENCNFLMVSLRCFNSQWQLSFNHLQSSIQLGPQMTMSSQSTSPNCPNKFYER